MAKNRYDRLLKNSAVFAIGNLGSKLIQVLLVPLYTYVLSTKDYGTVDLLTTTVNLLLPIISLSVFDAILRFVMDPDEDNVTVYSNALLITACGSIIMLAISPILSHFGFSNAYLTVILLVVQGFQSLNQQFARAINRVSVFAFNGILTTMVTAFLNVLLLVVFHTGITGYLLSMIGAELVSNVYLIITLRINKYVDLWKMNLPKIRSLLVFSIPLIPNSFAWWVTNASSRYFVLLFVGVGANGLFAVANKIPSLLATLNTIFFQSWQMSAIEEYGSSSKSGFYSQVFKYYADFLFLGTSAILLILKPFMHIFVSHTYFVAWKYVPFLLIAIIYSSFATFLGTNYVAAKKTAGAFTTTIIGAVSNVIMNIFLVRWWGLYGAGVSSALSYLIMWRVRVYDTKKFVSVQTPTVRIVVNQLIVVLQIAILYLVDQVYLEYSLLATLFVVSAIYNKDIFSGFVNKAISIIKK